MTIWEAMQTAHKTIRISCAPRWMERFGVNTIKMVVFEYSPTATRQKRIVCVTDSEATAVAALLNEEADEH